MQQLGNLSDDEDRIREELFLILSFFILTFENRQDLIKKIIFKKMKTDIIVLFIRARKIIRGSIFRINKIM